jgi:hypothetical protein
VSGARPAPSIPAGWQPGPPDFVGVGTARSGTTWWDELIHAHPDVARAPGAPKEIHFFDRFWDGSWSDERIPEYHAYFPRPHGTRAGEWTPGYMFDPWSVALLARAAPEARLLVLLRDPVERFRSGMTLTENRLTLTWSPREAAVGGFARGCYADQLASVFTAVPRDRVLVLQYERCVRETREELRRTYAFLGLDPAATDAVDVARRVNESRSAKVALRDDQRAALVRAYAPENERLAALVPDLDLSLWSAPR